MAQQHLTAQQVAEKAGRSKSSVHRDIERGVLRVAKRFPGYRGPVLVTASEAERYAARFEAKP